MNILLTGASGLIGQAVLTRLLAQGHQVSAVSRHPQTQQPNLRWLQADMATLDSAEQWQPLLDGIEVVINCAGIFREHGAQTFAALHGDAAIALFTACVQCNVDRVVQLSALGASLDAPSAYWRSKARADAALAGLPLDWAVVRPSLVYADHGASSQLFCQLAALPMLLLPHRSAPVQPIHLDDLAALLCTLALKASPRRAIIDAVGPRALGFGDYLQALRQGMGMAPARQGTLTSTLARPLARLAAHLPGSLVSEDALQMLAAGRPVDPAAAQSLLATPLRDPASFSNPALRAHHVLAIWLPILRMSLASLWLWTAWVSLRYSATGLHLLAESRLPPAWHWPALLSSSACDAVLGFLTLLRPSRRLWQLQLGLTLAYTSYISLWLPHWWLHPFGPISKNLPVLALMGLLAAATPANQNPKP
ncbi:SDR family oxidoreductase [Chitinimonas sp.]|uniref:SDR family oxidoreductase n=1 Tax=Chitinimonas sp. TaxID=1934313 RepID=UPI0035B4234A